MPNHSQASQSHHSHAEVGVRYYGVNDPVARKMLDRVDTLPKLVPPEDAAITTLYIGGLTPVITEDDIRDQFYSYGELQSVKKVRLLTVHSSLPSVSS